MLYQRSTFFATVSALAVSSRMAQAQTGTELHIGMPLTDEVTPMLYADQSGLLQRQGLNVLIEKVNSGNAVAAGVIGGSYQIGLSSSVPIITGHARGVPLLFCAPAGMYEAP